LDHPPRPSASGGARFWHPVNSQSAEHTFAQGKNVLRARSRAWDNVVRQVDLFLTAQNRSSDEEASDVEGVAHQDIQKRNNSQNRNIPITECRTLPQILVGGNDDSNGSSIIIIIIV
jgi:hypothetical protein